MSVLPSPAGNPADLGIVVEYDMGLTAPVRDVLDNLILHRCEPYQPISIPNFPENRQ